LKRLGNRLIKYVLTLSLILCELWYANTDVLAARGTPGVLMPQASGTNVIGTATAKIDISNASNGYIICNYSGSCPKVKMQLTGSNGITYTYSLHGGNEAFPLTSGSGSYKVGIYENVAGNKYAVATQNNFNANISNDFLPYLYSSQYVDFKPGSAVVAKGGQLAGGCSTDLEVVEKVYNYVTSNISYDFGKAKSVQSGYISNVDAILAQGAGICLDYAAVMTSMLRSQGIPTRLEVGYANTAYHAWISTYITDVGWVNGIIKFNGNAWSRMDPTFASTSGTKGAQTFVGNGTNYTTRFIY